MKAIGITGLGSPDVITQVEVDDPVTRPGEVLIKTEATAYNNIDALLRTEDFGLKFPVVPGSDLVGRLVVGERAGQRVVVNPGIPCGECNDCLAGRRCRYVRILGVHRSGGYGEYVTVPSTQCFGVPDGVTTEEAAAVPLDFLTAWRMLKTRVGLKQGQSVLIWGATGALGSSAISIVQSLGGKAIAVTRRSDTVEKLMGQGAEAVIDASTNDIAAEVERLTDGIGVDIVFEGPGTATWETSVKAVSQGGAIVTAGVTTGHITSLDIEDLYYRQISMVGSRMGYDDEFRAVFDSFTAGNIRPLISDVLGLSEAAVAHEKAAASDRCGKIVMIYDL